MLLGMVSGEVLIYGDVLIDIHINYTMEIRLNSLDENIGHMIVVVLSSGTDG